MSATHLFKAPYVRKYTPRNTIPEGWVSLKEWILGEAERKGVGYGAVFNWLRNKNRYPDLELKQVNRRVVWVKLPE